jgi:transcriptional/translational regulatory protein YebC/TACO1
MEDALDCGADDVVKEDGGYTIYTDPDDFGTVNDGLTAKGYSFVSAQIEMVPQNYIKLPDPEDVKKFEKMLDVMEDDDDVQNVWHNWDEE